MSFFHTRRGVEGFGLPFICEDVAAELKGVHFSFASVGFGDWHFNFASLPFQRQAVQESGKLYPVWTGCCQCAWDVLILISASVG